MLDNVTPLLVTYNEAANLPRTMKKLFWAKRIVVVDSGSHDETAEILKSYPQVEVFQKRFIDFASQCNYGLQQVRTPWVLSLDADYELSGRLIEEIKSLDPSEDISGFKARFVYRIYGRPLRGSLYPPRVVLYRRIGAKYRNEGHGHRVSVSGRVQSLSGQIFHDDRKSLSRWLDSQQRYAREEARHLLSSSRGKLSRIDRWRLRAWIAPVGVGVYTLFAKGCVFDGWPGWFYVLQRVLAETILALEIIDQRLRRDI